MCHFLCLLRVARKQLLCLFSTTWHSPSQLLANQQKQYYQECNCFVFFQIARNIMPRYPSRRLALETTTAAAAAATNNSKRSSRQISLQNIVSVIHFSLVLFDCWRRRGVFKRISLAGIQFPSASKLHWYIFASSTLCTEMHILQILRSSKRLVHFEKNLPTLT